MSGHIVIGLGTGRCGTKSLSVLLNGCEGASVTHEGVHTLPFIPQPGDTERALKHLEKLSQRHQITGDVAWYWLMYVPAIVERFGDRVRFVGLWRDHETCVPSIARSFGHKLIRGDGRYPQFLRPDANMAASAYWDLYNGALTQMRVAFPERVRMFLTESLSDEAGQSVILSAAGIPEQCRRFQPECHHNRS